MDQSTCEANSGQCPVCFVHQRNVVMHLNGHSKEEIIQSLNQSDLRRSQVCDISENGLSSGSVENHTFLISNNISIPQTTANLTENNSEFTTKSFVSPAISMPTSFPVSASSSLPVIGGCSTFTYNDAQNYVNMQNSFNLDNVYRGITNQNMTNGINLSQSLINQHIPYSPSMISPLNSQFPNHMSNTLQPPPNTLQPLLNNNIKLGSLMLNQDNLTVKNNIPNIHSSKIKQGQQNILCVFPVPQMQPSASAYVVYGNSVVPSPNIVSPIIQQPNFNYIVGSNNSVFANDSQYYWPQNASNLQICNSNERTLFNRNMSINSSDNISQEINCSINNSLLSNAQIPNSDLKTLNENHQVHQETALLEDNYSNCENEEKTFVEVGNNIIISLPKDIVNKKERVRELINRELVHALVINDENEYAFPPSPKSSEKRKSSTRSTEWDPDECNSFKESSTQGPEYLSDNLVKLETAQSSLSEPNTYRIDDYSGSQNESFLLSSASTSYSKSSHKKYNTVNKKNNETQLDIGEKLRESIYDSGLSMSDNKADIIHISDDNSTESTTEWTVFSKPKSGNSSKMLHRTETLPDDALASTSMDFTSRTKATSFWGKITDISVSDRKVLNAVEHAIENSNSSQFSVNPYHEADSFEVSEEQRIRKSYSKTYMRVKKSKESCSNTIIKNVLPQHVSKSSNINITFPNHCSQLMDDWDETLTGDNEAMNSTEIKNCPSSQSSLYSGEFSLENSKQIEDSQGHSFALKIENSESNDTQTEEVMSLKASEILADSDSEGATLNEEIAEAFFAKSCIFASQEFPPCEEAWDNLDSTKVKTENRDQITFAKGQLKNGSNNESSTISLTLDSSCSILPADCLAFSNMFDIQNEWNENYYHDSEEDIFLDSKPVVSAPSSEHNSVSSPLASTSGLQKVYKSEKSMIKKNLRDDEEYDFDYESDCYADSDSELHHFPKGTLESGGGSCYHCNKTFKSLKEKLLHSNHHSLCSNVKLRSIKEVSDSVNENSEKFLPIFDTLPECSTGRMFLEQKFSEINDTLNAVMERERLERMKVENDTTVEDIQQVAESSSGYFNCIDCCKTFKTEQQLTKHRVCAFKSWFICPICHVEFPRRIDRRRHLKSHSLSNLRCKICHRKFENFRLWSNHQLHHMGLFLHECKFCGQRSKNKIELQMHYRHHTGEKPFKCETCSQSFVSSQCLKRHLFVHMKGQEVECDICRKVYKNILCLAKHKLTAHPRKKRIFKKRSDFMCESCNEVFNTKKKLLWHQEIHKRWPKKCDMCGESFVHQSNLTKHIRIKHNASYVPSGSEKDTVSCPICNKAYKRTSLSLHMRIHNGVKPYKCDVCDKEFNVKCNYISHKWVHSGTRDRPLKCKICEKSFHRQKFLEAHIRSHKKIRPFTCNECGKAFIYKSNYQTHLKLHNGVKDHECSHCGKTFHRKYNLNNHMRIHTGETPFECTICGKVFTQKSNYNVHMKAFHVERQTISEEV